MNKVYYSKVDAWIVVLLAAAFVGAAFFCAYSQNFEFTDKLSKDLTIIGCSAVAICMLSIPMKYVLEDKALVVHSGLLKTRIEYSRISSAYKTISFWSAPAWSVKRVRINGTRGRVLGLDMSLIGYVSPKDRDAFIKDLEEKIKNSKA